MWQLVETWQVCVKCYSDVGCHQAADGHGHHATCQSGHQGPPAAFSKSRGRSRWQSGDV